MRGFAADPGRRPWEHEFLRALLVPPGSLSGSAFPARFGSSLRPPALRDSYDLARQIAELLIAHENNEAKRESEDEVEFTFEVVLGTQTYSLICRPVRPPIPSSGLSPREKEVVRLVALGLPNKAIAQVLEISLWTVATYVRRVFAKLGVTTRAQMVAKILQDNIVDLEGRRTSAGGAGGPGRLADVSELRRLGGFR